METSAGRASGAAGDSGRRGDASPISSFRWHGCAAGLRELAFQPSCNEWFDPVTNTSPRRSWIMLMSWGEYDVVRSFRCHP